MLEGRPGVSIVVPFLEVPYRILIIYLVKPKKELQWRQKGGLDLKVLSRFGSRALQVGAKP